jgi:hypothetical protein
MMFAVALSALALAGTAASVPVSGGTPAERAIVRQALTSADPGAVGSVRIDARHYLVLGAPARRATGVRHERGRWEALALAASIAARLAARGDELAGYDIQGDTSGSFAAEGSPRVGPSGARQLLAVALANARSAGLGVRTARILKIGGGLVDVVVRLRESQLFDPASQAALMTLFGPPTTTAVALHFLSVEAPDGTAVAYGGSYADGGSWAYGGDTGRMPVPRALPQRLWHARTDVVVHLTRGIGPARERTFQIACGGTLPPRDSRCRRLLADRWALLVPAPGWDCTGGPIGGWSVSLEGTVAGHGVKRDYSACYGLTVQRWARFLGV